MSYLKMIGLQYQRVSEATDEIPSHGSILYFDKEGSYIGCDNCGRYFPLHFDVIVSTN